MNSDSYFEIGSTHLVCQDYALSGSYKDMYYAIVSDGCSSAPHSEIGAQILCHASRHLLHMYYDLFKENTETDILTTLLSNSILKRSDDIRKIYPINHDALQATLLIAVMVNDMNYVFGWGDGIVIHNRGKDFQDIHKIEYPDTNAPFYLATNKEAYIKKFGEDRKVRYTMSIKGREDEVSELPFDTPYVSVGDTEPISPPVSSITIGTDGFDQYLDDRHNPVPLSDIVPEITDYPNLKGPFVKRTMNFLKRDLSRKSWSHADDIGIATIVKDL